MQIFEYLDYRAFLRNWLKDKKDSEPALTFAQIAGDIGMQRPGFSKVLNGDTDFSADQVFLLGRRLGLSEAEQSYLELLVEHERTGLEERKQVIRQQLLSEQKNHVSTPQSVEAKDFQFSTDQDRLAYFSSPWAPILHIFLTVPRYQANPEKIRQELQMSPDDFASHLQLLRRMGLIKRLDGDKWAAGETSVHAKDLSGLPLMQQLLYRAVSLNRLSLIPLKERFGLSVAFSADEKDFEKSRQILVKAITEIQSLVADSKPHEVYQLSVDLFPWSRNG